MVASALLAAGITGCSAAREGTAGPAGNGGTAQTGTAQTASPGSEGPRLATATPFWIRGTTVAPGRPRQIEPGTDPVATAVSAVENGPDAAEQLGGLTTAVLGGAGLYASSVDGDVATINLARIFYSTTRDARPQVAQMVFTLTSLSGVEKVRFLIEGQPNGAIGVLPLGRGDFPDMAPPVLADTPYPGQIVTGHAFKLSGTTDPGVVSVPWRIEGPDGAPVASGALPAEATRATAPRLRLLQEIGVPSGVVGQVVLIVENVDPTGTPREPFRIPLEVRP